VARTALTAFMTAAGAANAPIRFRVVITHVLSIGWISCNEPQIVAFPVITKAMAAMRKGMTSIEVMLTKPTTAPVSAR